MRLEHGYNGEEFCNGQDDTKCFVTYLVKSSNSEEVYPFDYNWGEYNAKAPIVTFYRKSIPPEEDNYEFYDFGIVYHNYYRENNQLVLQASWGSSKILLKDQNIEYVFKSRTGYDEYEYFLDVDYTMPLDITDPNNLILSDTVYTNITPLSNSHLPQLKGEIRIYAKREID